MITTSTPTSPPSAAARPGPSVHGINQPTPGSVLGGLATAFVIQVGAALTAAIALVIVVAAAFANFGNYGEEQESTWWVVFSVPLAVAALAIYVLSGYAASRVMRTGLGWLTLLTAPALVMARLAVVVLG